MIRLNFEQRREVHEFLTSVIRKLDGGYCEYTGKWSDGEVARKFGYSPSNVMSVRRSSFGQLRGSPSGHTDEYDVLKADIDVLRKENEVLHLDVKDLQNAIANLEKRHQFAEAWMRGKGYLVPNGRMHHKEPA